MWSIRKRSSSGQHACWQPKRGRVPRHWLRGLIRNCAGARGIGPAKGIDPLLYVGGKYYVLLHIWPDITSSVHICRLLATRKTQL